MDEAITELLRLPDNRRLFQQRPEPAPRRGPQPQQVTQSEDKERKGTWANACALRRTLIFRLRKYGRNSSEACLLLEILERCRRMHRCCSPACPKCTYAVQGLWAEALAEFRTVGNILDRCVTIIALRRILPGNRRGYVKVGYFGAELDDALDEANVSLMLGAFDFDFMRQELLITGRSYLNW